MARRSNNEILYKVFQEFLNLCVLSNQSLLWSDSAHDIAHNKIMIIDWETVITGSFNFTKAAEEKNAENLLVIRDKTLAAKYVENWKVH